MSFVARWVSPALVWGLAGLACTGQIDATPAPAPEGTPAVPGGRPGAPPPAAKEPTSPGASPAVACRSVPAPVPVARLTNLQYRQSLEELLGTAPALSLPGEVGVDGYENHAASQTPSFAVVESFARNAATVAEAITPRQLAPCAAGAAEDTCGGAFVDGFLSRAFRRPLAPDERERWLGHFRASRTAHGYDQAVRMLVEAALQAPQFLYRLEVGAPVPGRTGVSRLTGHELAARLALFLTGTGPDAALSAASARLDTDEELSAQATRLLASPRGRQMMAAFHQRWLRLDRIADLMKAPAVHPNYSDAVTTALRNSAATFVANTARGKSPLSSLLEDARMDVESSTARIFDVPAPAAGMVTTLDVSAGGRRGGFLTHPGWLAAFAHEKEDSPVERGLFVLERLLCSPPPPPPPGVNDEPPAAPAGSPARTTRQRLEQLHHNGACGACHRRIDGIGFAFSHFDAVGRWRDMDNGAPVDASGELVGTRDADGPFRGARELSRRLSASTQVAECATTHWLRWALGRTETEADACAVAAISERARAAGGGVEALIVALVTSDLFRLRDTVVP